MLRKHCFSECSPFACICEKKFLFPSPNYFRNILVPATNVACIRVKRETLLQKHFTQCLRSTISSFRGLDSLSSLLSHFRGGGGGGGTVGSDFPTSRTLYSGFPPHSFVVSESVCFFYCKFISYFSRLPTPWISGLPPSLLPSPDPLDIPSPTFSSPASSRLFPTLPGFPLPVPLQIT